MTPPIRAVGCIRVSTKGQAERGFSIPEQDSTIRACCERNGLTLVEMVTDDGVSGTILERPAIRRITELAEARAFDVLVLVKVNRLGRENHIIQQLLARFRDLGIRTLFVEGGSGDTKEERLQLGILSALAGYEWEQLREMTMSGRQRKAKQGKVPGNVDLYGYHLITRAEATVKPEYGGRDGELEIIEAEAAIVRELFQRAAAGATFYALAVWLTEAGVPTRRGGSWHQSIIRAMLANTAYVGTFAYGRRAWRQQKELTTGGNSRVSTSARAPEEWISIPVPPILTRPDGSPDEPLFYAVQERLERNLAAFRGRPSTVWPLAGVVYCGSCVTSQGGHRRCTGMRQTRSKGQPGYEYRRYVCGSRKGPVLPYCGTEHSANRLEALALEVLRQVLEPGELGRRAHALVTAQLQETGSAREEVDRLEEQLAEVDVEEQKVAVLALKGFSDSVIEKMLTPLQERRAGLKERLRAATERLWCPDNPTEAEHRAEARAVGFREALDRAADDPALFQQLCRSLLRITLWKGSPPAVEVRADAILGGEVVH